MPDKPIVLTVALVTALTVAIGNASLAGEFCASHPWSIDCDNPPALPDEVPSQPSGPQTRLMVTVSTTANTAYVPPYTGVTQR